MLNGSRMYMTLASLAISGASLLSEMPSVKDYLPENPRYAQAIQGTSFTIGTTLEAAILVTGLLGYKGRRPRDPFPPGHENIRTASTDITPNNYDHLPGIHNSEELYRIS